MYINGLRNLNVYDIVMLRRSERCHRTSSIIHLPRAPAQRPPSQGLGLYLHIGHNGHNEMLHLISTGERGFHGFVIDARKIERNRDLISEARRHDLDVIFDPKIQQMGFPGSHTGSLAALPWGLERLHNVADFDGALGKAKATQIVEAAVSNDFTQILGPTHLLSGANDPWLRRDIAMMNWTAREISDHDVRIGLIYPLALPMAVLRRAAERRAIIAAIADASCDAIWLKVENFGDDATGEKMAAYIDACRDFHARRIPVIGDHIGGLPGLGALAFGAVGGIAHGVTMQQNFKASSWRHPPAATPKKGGASWRVYVPQLDMMLKRDMAEALLSISIRVKAMCGCRDTHCCPLGVRDMLGHPARHAVYQRVREIENLSSTPQSIRARHYVEHNVRPVSDAVAGIAAISTSSPDLMNALKRKQLETSRFRQTMGYLVDDVENASVAMAPPRWQARKSS